MKRVCLIRNVESGCYGGGETYQLKLADQLKKNGFLPVIVTSSKKLQDEGRRLGFKIIEASYIKRQNWSGKYNLLLPVYISKIWKLKKWYEKLFVDLKPETVNIQSRDDWIAATMAAKKLGIKVLWTDHMDFRSWVLQNVDVWYKNIIGKKILKCAKDVKAIIVISDYEKKYFKKIYNGQNVELIKNGTIDNFLKYHNVKMRSQSFVFVGRVVDYKGIKELVEAFRIVRKGYPEATLNIYGAGEIDKFKKIVGEGVKFYGETSEPLKALAENEIFVLPSYKEGLSLSLLDAAMMEKTIIATNIDGNPEVVEDGKTGLLVPAKNAKALAVAMEKVLKDRDLAIKLAENARKKYEAEFDFEKIFAEKMLMLYNDGKEKK